MLIPSWLPAKHILAVAALAVAGYGGFWLRDLQAQAADGARLAAQAEGQRLLTELAADVSAKTEAAIGEIRITNQTIHQKAVHEIQRETVYRDCVLPGAGRVLINDARAAANANGGTLPAPAAAE